MRIYIAGSWSERETLASIGRAIHESLGHEITSRWFHEQEHARPFACAVTDLEDIDRADCVLVFMSGKSTRGGRMVEFGYAIAKGKRIAVIGERTNVFTHLVPNFPTWADALAPEV